MQTIHDKLTVLFTRKTGMKWLPLLLLIAGLQAGGQNLNNPNKQGPLGTYVNVLSGNLFVPRTDMLLPARGFNLAVRFYYNSFLLNEDYGYGKGWTFQYNIQYTEDTVPGRKIIRWGDGREDKYDSLPGGLYKSPRGFFTKLVQYGPGKFRLTEKDSVTYFFDDPSGKKITRMQEPNGNFIQFSYSGGRLSSLANNAGQSVSFTYDGNGRLASATDAVAQPSRTFTYKYDAAGNLTEVKDPLNGTCQYTYLVNGPMKTLADQNHNTIDIIYFPDFSTREIIGCNKRLSFSYDTTLKKTVVTDYLESGANQVTTYTYQKLDNLSWVTSMSGNCCGFNLRFEYDEQGNKIRETDANGYTYAYTYDGNGNLLTVTDPLGGKSVYTYSKDFNQITSYKDPNGNLYTLDYDADGNMVKLTAPGNNVYTAAYNSKGDLISSTDPKGNVFTYNYDAYGNPATVTGPDGFNATLSFDARGNLLSTTDARGHHRSAEYDILDRLKKIKDPLNQAMQYSYDAAGNLVSLTNKNNETIFVSYDASNRPVKITGATGNTTEIGYDAMDNVTRIKDPLGRQLEFGYDTRNRVNRLKNPEGLTATLDHDANGNITQLVQPNGRTITYTYDKQNRLVRAADGTGEIAALTYDTNGNLTSYKNGTGALVSFAYDSLNRVVQITDPLGNRTRYAYDKNDNVVSVTDRNGFTRHYTYDGMNRVKTFTDNNGFVITTGYDAAGNVISLTDQNGNTTTYTYDQLNRRSGMTYPDGRSQQYAYNNKGNLITKKLTDGSAITYTYDTLNRMLTKTLPGGEVYSYAYDKTGRLTAATNSRGTVHFSYDNLGRVTAETFDGRTVQYHYNTAGRTQAITYPDGSVVVKEFDTRNRLTRILKDSLVMAEYAYNNADRVTAKRMGNGVQTILQYDGANRLSSLTTAGGSIQQLRYTYDNEGNKVAINRFNNPSLSETFTYDKGYRLTGYKKGSQQSTFAYDAVGNRTAANLDGATTTYTSNNLNQLTSKNGAAFSYDNRGNLTFDGQFYKTYDAEGRLLKDSSSPSGVLTYGYDAIGRRVLKTINGIPFKYTYSGPAQIEERDAANALLNKTVFNHFLSPVMNEKGGASFFYHQDHLQSVAAMTTANGRLLESYQYDAYGKLQRYDSAGHPLASSLAGNRFGFTGQEWDSATASYRFFYRTYSPENGVFNQRDLIGYADGTGLYQYVGNNPANGIDVWGLDEVDDKWELPPGGYYVVEEMYGGNPCYTDHKKIKYITKWEIQRTKDLMIDYLKNFENSTDFEAIGSADSRYYEGLAKYQMPSGDNMYYFDGQAMHNYEVNYFFTGYAAGTRGYGTTSAQAMARSWNAAKGARDFVAGDGLGRFKSAFESGEVRAENMSNGTLEANSEFGTGMTIPGNVDPGLAFSKEFDNKVIPGFGEWWPVINPKTGEKGYEFFPLKKIKSEDVMAFRRYIKENCPPPGGTRKPPPGPPGGGPSASTTWVFPIDPNEIIGPDGKPGKKWVSVKDRMNYTIRCENDTAASSPARFIRIAAPVHPKHDATTLELGSFGFNNQTFDIPAGLSSYYQRLDCRDSMGLYVDVVAGYDQLKNEIFWEFRGIDPLTLLPSDDPEKGILFLQDTAQPLYGHGFANFSIKPLANAKTLDTTAAKAAIVFDENEAIPTNVWTNTLDAVAPASRLTEASFNGNLLTLKWTGHDDSGGSGLKQYTLYVSPDGVNYSILAAVTTRTDTTFKLAGAATYCFFVLATDSVGNAEVLDNRNILCATGSGPVLPVTWLTFTGKNVEKDNLLEWSTAAEQNSKEFRVQRSLDGSSFTTIGTVAATGNTTSATQYRYADRNIDRLNSAVMYYRLQQVDREGKESYSGVVRLTYQTAVVQKAIVYPNPTGGSVIITIGDPALIGSPASVFDQTGKLLQTINITTASQPVDLSRYVNGVYYIRLANKEVLKVVKQ